MGGPKRPASPRAVAALALAFALALAAPTRAQQDILHPDMTRRVFYVDCSGSINSTHTFTGVRLQITVTHTGEGKANPLQVVIESMPALAQKDSFYLNSNEMVMDAFSDTLRCRLPGTGTSRSDLHFYYMSPALYKSRLGPTHRDQERMRQVDRTAKPIKIMALEAELTMRFTANSVSGTIRMTGHDQLDRKPARYVASFQGQEYVHARPAH